MPFPFFLFLQFAPKNRYGQGKCPDCGFLLRPGATSCPLCSPKSSGLTKNAIVLTVLVATLLGVFFFLCGLYLEGGLRL